MAEVLGNVVRYVGDVKHPLLEVRDERRRVCIISIVSDRGFAGAFNSNIIRMTEAHCSPSSPSRASRPS